VSAPATGPLRLTVLGQVSAPDADGSVLVPVAGLGANLLLALALEHGRGIGAVRAVDEVWPDAPPASGRAALQTLVSRLRSAHGAGLLVSTATGYALGVDPADVDLHRATAAAEQAREALAGGDPGTAERTAGAALALWTGEPGTGATAEPLLAALAVRAEGVRRDLLRLRTRALLDLGDPGAVASADALSEIAPLDDGAHLLRMRALHAAGRTSEAVAAFAEYRERLRDTLGTDPAPEVATFHVELLSEPSAAPVPASSSRVLGLRVAPNALIGRDADVAAVVGLLGAAPVVTVLGTGGLGKTRLVQEVARRSVGRFGAVYVTELSAVREQADVGTVLAEALRAGESAVRPGMAEARVRILRDRVVDRLSEQPTLLVLDNCEHVLDEVAGWVADLIGTVPGLQVLVTSRAPLGVAGERVHPLEPLPAREPDGAPGPAVRLFTERATAVRPGLTLPADVVARLCDRLDGLPLAIELAAARTRSLTVEEVERRLTDRFALLVGGGAGTPERHRTLRAVIEWSWDLLTERQRVLARRVSQLSDGFGADAAAALVAGDGATEQQVLDDLDALVAQSLLRAQEHRPTGTMRYRMLETVREFGDREVDRVGERDRVLDLLLDWGREVALVVVGDMQRPERILLDPVGEREKDNLVTLLRRALDREHATEGPTRRADAITALFAITGVRWVVQGAQEELADVQREVLPLCLGHRPPVGQGAGWTLGLCLIAGTELLYGDLRAGTRARVELRRVVAGRSDLGSVLRLLADLVAHVLDVEASEALLAEARRSSDWSLRRLALMMSSTYAENGGDVESALRYQEEGYALAGDEDDTWGQAMSAAGLAGLYGQTLRAERAMDWTRIAELHVARLQAGSASPLIDILAEGLRQTTGFTLLAMDEFDEADAVFTAMVQASPDVRDSALLGGLGSAEAARGRGETERGLAMLRALASRAGDGARGMDPWLLLVLASCLAAHAIEGRTDAPGLAAMVGRLRGHAADVQPPGHPVRDAAVLGTSSDGQPTGPMHTDRPVLGTALVGVAAWLLAVEPQDASALRMLALGEVFQSRQDVPATARARHWARAEAVHGVDAVAAARAEVAAWPPDELVRRAITLLRGEPA
jgi:predicted ATPase/DNA-binding SARP family transcriptional activator